MNHDDIIRLARQVADPDTTDPLCGGDQRDLITLTLDEMVRFAALVAAAEREACARVCENIEYHDETIDDIYYSDHYAKAIRARGEA